MRPPVTPATVVVEPFSGPDAEWDAFVRAQAGWTHFHLIGWRTLLERVFGHECLYFVARDTTSGHVAGVLPLVRVRSLLFGHYLVSMPFLNYGGPLGSADAIMALVDHVVALAARTAVKLLELRSRTPLPIDLPVSHRKLTVVLDLPADANALFTSLPAKLRSQIRRPRKDGVTVKFGAAEIPAFHQVFAHHMRDLGTPALPKAFFEALADVFPGDVHFAVAYHDEQPIACGCGFLWNGEFEITWASALRSHSAMSPNMLVYWELMERMTRAGAHLFNFGRCSPDSGTHRFKMQWGGREEPLWWYQRAAAANGVAATPSPDHGIFSLATRAWQRLPVALATRLGPSIVRNIP
ncbi:MAG TPA: FemAB family XrtA/PEP-CTERM system-associated protein [Gemmatimonadaceae bacterium]|nr:FemAB family XrtA/PEP-CTERM system-associated protein [Gemmatimonadaceae bacterium]